MNERFSKILGLLKSYIGDVAVVVIGVLLALAVSQWEQGLQEKERKRASLEAIVQDFQENLITAQEGREVSAYYAAAGRKLLDVTSGRTSETDANSLAMTVEAMAYVYNTPYLRTAWDDLVSSGGLGILDDEELRRDIGRFYQDQEQKSVWEAEWLNYYTTYRSSVHQVLEADVKLEISRVHSWGSDTSSEMETTWLTVSGIVQSFNSVPNINNQLADVIMTRDVALILFERELESIEQILARLGANLSAL